MKKIILLIVIVTAFASCQKDNTTPVTSNEFTGNWELRGRYGGLIGINEHYAPGNMNLLQLNIDSTYKLLEKGALNKQGGYSIRLNTDTLDGVVYNRIYFDDDTQYGTEIRLHGDTLTIGTTITDNIAVDYQRVK
ncbi:hypothetical protein EWM62_08145 [Mucilaginibacter terrigena]|uniref:Lipocalin-like domain-containing protein n=1 Tax=Mucilaginibacter terrigena TaxID=2492395 RepID=A0A4Q5LMW5_9SPHI|nr:membrane lipoprotein lipid attachment site-containing protein [Mucilaginibacter terrigena]RYU90613.1 hypothetical protein EWM62_08145 [Mucilaginibacter terrigena]